ncbi:MAG: hypothetical protein M3R67_03140 [Acidobacteriota bacterium]|nr:hypothetical protein [Acidobacteriota bacterium]
MFLTNHTKSSKLTFLISGLLLLATCIGETRGQQSGSNHPSMRDQVRAIQRADLDRLLLSSLPAKTDSESSRVAVMKQIREDFKDLQGLNNKMMAEAWARETLDYFSMSDMVSRIRGKAVRLKMNLNLPDSGNIEKVASDPNISNSREFRAALLVLDRSIMSFVTNPLFQKPNTIEVNQATRAGQDLESVIERTADLKKIASRLAKVPRLAK